MMCLDISQGNFILVHTMEETLGGMWQKTQKAQQKWDNNNPSFEMNERKKSKKKNKKKNLLLAPFRVTSNCLMQYHKPN